MAEVASSVLARLRNHAKNSKISYQQCLQLFCQEEFLRRLAASSYADNLILKGGLFIYTLTNFESRATVDIDFLLREKSAELESVEQMIKEIIATPTGNDFVIFETRKFERISPQRKYHGVSTQIIGKIKQVRVPFDVDIGVGDVIIPKPEKRKIATQLSDFPSPEVLTYSLESTIAEKFEAILQRFELTSRMKDFYDISYLSHLFDFDGRKLQEAIFRTLQNRATTYEKNSFDRIMALAADDEMNIRWRYFTKNIEMEASTFRGVLTDIDAFLRPVFNAIVTENEFFKIWHSNERSW